MRSLTQVEFKSLAEYRGEWCVSLYMSTDPARLQNRKDTLRLRNLLGDVEKNLRQKGMRPAEIEKMLHKANSLAVDSDFWRSQRGGLAMFIGPAFFSHYELDYKFPQISMISNRFHLRPLLQAERKSEVFYLLKLSQNNVQLFKGGENALEMIDLLNVPRSLEEALQFEEGGKQLQHHVVPRARGGGGQAIYHGSAFPDEKDSILHFFRRLDDGVCNALRNEKAPLVLAGVDYIRALYAQVSEYPELVDKGISGSVESVEPRKLFDLARDIAASCQDVHTKDTLNSYHQNRSVRKASDVLGIILPAAFHGQVETLFLKEDVHCWGEFNEEDLQLAYHSEKDRDSEDLYDIAAVTTKLNGGEVIFLPAEKMPDRVEIAANFYYELDTVS